MRKKKKTLNSSGLTLMEIVIALTISGIILGILLSAMRLGYKSQEKSMERDELSQRMRTITDRLGWLVRGAFPYTVQEEDKKIVYFSGSSERVGFVTTSVDKYSDSPADRAGLKWVEISADENGLRIGEKIFFLQTMSEEAGGEEYILDKTVRGIKFEYLDGGLEDGPAQWVDTWNSEEKEYIPSAVRMHLIIEFKGKPVSMPVIQAAIRTGGPDEETKAWK